jgi:glycosyltransferase involved in cell wall biosynthesis
MSSKPRVFFITGIPTPFMAELAAAVNDLQIVEYHVIFTEPQLAENRGGHWKAFSASETVNVRTGESPALNDYLRGLFSRHRPTVTVCGYGRGQVYETVYELCQRNKSVFGVFAEQPMYGAPPKQIARRAYYAWLWRRMPPAFVLAVGDRAVEFYRGLVREPATVSFFPYYQNLAPVFAIPDRRRGERLRFLFSGRLVEQHAIRRLAAAFERLAKTHAGTFSWCVSGSGGEEKWIRQAMAREAALAKSVFFDREFADWNDRLRPFAEADVLTLPSFHAGWGLVVPEALASGMPVISTRGVESARYYIENMINGLLIAPTENEIYAALRYFVENPAAVDSMRPLTRASARRGDVTEGARKMLAILERWL